MWFEVLPSAVIITVAMSIPQFLPAVINSVAFGNVRKHQTVLCNKLLIFCLIFQMFRRKHSDEYQLQYLRDRRLTGNPYKVQVIIPHVF